MIYYFVYDNSIEKKLIDDILKKLQSFAKEVQTVVYQKNSVEFLPKSTVFLMIDDHSFIEWIRANQQSELEVVILPYEKNPLQRKNYALPSSIDELLTLYRKENKTYMQSFISCNRLAVLGCIAIGEEEIIKRDFWSFLKRLFSLKLKNITIKTQKEHEINTAALFIEAGNEAYFTKNRTYFFKSSYNQCKRVASIVYAPGSIIETIKLKYFLSKLKKEEGKTLPEGIGIIKSNELLIKSNEEQKIEVNINGKIEKFTQIEIKREDTRFLVLSGYENCVKGEEKESIRTQKIPAGADIINFFTKKHLPLLPIASENDFAELFTKLRESSRITKAYLILLIISVLMATTGLFQNSAPTIIGAMILAPLMAPIITFSMGAIRFDDNLLLQSSKSIVFSIILSLILSAFFSIIFPFSHITQQMAIRTHPTLLDLGVAILAGIAAAYGYANSKVGESLAGVAIAVALVPPLCVSGIGIGWGNLDIFYNAFLLFLANMVGIIMASGIMFYLMGYASHKYVSAAFLMKLMMVSIVAFPLLISTRTVFKEERIYREISHIAMDNIKLKINDISVQKNRLLVQLNIISKKELTKIEKEKLLQMLKSKVDKNVRFIINYKIFY